MLQEVAQPGRADVTLQLDSLPPCKKATATAMTARSVEVDG
jgi:hypothetical protein